MRTPEDFASQIPSVLKGLSNEQVELVEKLQPYNVNKWLSRIRDLSNPDKHRHPIKLSAGKAVSIFTRFLTERPHPGLDIGSSCQIQCS